MKRKILALFFGILWSLLLIPSVFAMDTDVDPSIRIYDYADLLTDEEEEALSETARELSEKWSVDLVTVTIDDDEGLTSMEYADDFFDYNGFSATGVLMRINMDEREVWFSTAGSCIRIFSDRRIEAMVQACLNDLSDGDYNGAVETFFSKADSYLTAGEEPDSGSHDVSNPEDIFYGPEEPAWQRSLHRMPMYLLIAAVVSGITVLIMVATNRSAKRAKEAGKYLANNSVHITLRNDQFLHSTVTKTRIESDSSSGGSSGGGSSTHTSSSGSSHGGGGGRF